MAEGMTDAEIAEIRERAERATPGPWRIGIRIIDAVFIDTPNGPTHITSALPPAADRDADAAFIAAARTDVPRLLDEIERLRADAGRWALVAQRAMIFTGDDGEVGACLYLADTAEETKGLTAKERRIVDEDVIQTTPDMMARVVDALIGKEQSHPAAHAATTTQRESAGGE